MTADKNAPEPDNDTRMHGLLGQLRNVTDRLSGLAESLPFASALPSLPSLPGLPPTPGAFSAAQLQATASVLTAQRAGIAAMQAQLAAFDEQLEVLGQILAPLVEWSATWANLEKGIRDLRPGAGDRTSAPRGERPA